MSVRAWVEAKEIERSGKILTMFWSSLMRGTREKREIERDSWTSDLKDFVNGIICLDERD